MIVLDKALKRIIRFHIFMFFLPFLFIMGVRLDGNLYGALAWGVVFSIVGLFGTVMEMDKIGYDESIIPIKLKKQRDDRERRKEEFRVMGERKLVEDKVFLARMRSEHRRS